MSEENGSPKVDQIMYPHNCLEAFGNGCLMDLRVRFAFELLKSPMFVGAGVPVADGLPAHTPNTCAVFALELACELMAEASKRGLVQPLPEDGGELTPALRDQARRTASFQALQQIEGAKFVQDEQARVVPVAPGLHTRGGH